MASHKRGVNLDGKNLVVLHIREWKYRQTLAHAETPCLAVGKSASPVMSMRFLDLESSYFVDSESRDFVDAESPRFLDGESTEFLYWC